MQYHLKTPLGEEEVRRLKIGDVIYLSGVMFTARDAAHRRILQYYAEGRVPPFKSEGHILYHCGPIMRRVTDMWQVVSAGPTTSMRMESVEAQVIEKSRIRGIIGKGGMGLHTTDAMKQWGCVYYSYPGGAGALAATRITKVQVVHWLDLGMPEAVWVFEIQDFGPLMVTIDALGSNHYQKVQRKVKKNTDLIYQSL